MIIPDINLLVYAYNRDAPLHCSALTWWEQVIRRSTPVGIPWVVLCGYIRIMTDPRILQRPLAPGKAVAHVRSWVVQPSVSLLDPGPRHLDILAELLDETGVGGRLMTDTHLAALAIEHHAELHSNDRDFARFTRLRWINPLA